MKSRFGIVSYGAALPQFCILAKDLEEAQGKQNSGIPQALGVKQKTIPDIDEDTITLATAAAWQSLQRLPVKLRTEVMSKRGCLFVGSESHPYAVKPSGTVVKQALGLSEHLSLADMQFACKAGTQALQTAFAHVAAGFCTWGMAIGSDTSQSAPGDVLEFTAGAGAASFVVGSKHVVANLLATISVATDTPDFWRRPGQHYPQHAGRFSGEPAYFYHVSLATETILKQEKLTPSDIDYCIFHTPNAKFPQAAAKKLGFSTAQAKPSLVVKDIGNTYAAAVPLALAAILDQAQANKTILVVSYGSGAGSDAFLFRTTQELVDRRRSWNQLIKDQVKKLQPVSYLNYQKAMGLII